MINEGNLHHVMKSQLKTRLLRIEIENFNKFSEKNERELRRRTEN